MPAELTTLAALKTYMALPATWAASSAFFVGGHCRANGALYVCITAGTSAGSGTGPSGTSTDITDGTVHWKYLGPNLSTDDATLERLIEAVSTCFANYADREFVLSTHTHTTSGKGGTVLVLPEFPVASITSLTIDGSAVAARASVGGAGYVLVDAHQLMLDGGDKFTRGIANVTVVYSAGYSSIPADLEQACIETCTSWYKRRSRTDEESKAIQGEVITFSTAELPRAAKSVLDLYKRCWPR